MGVRKSVTLQHIKYHVRQTNTTNISQNKKKYWIWSPAKLIFEQYSLAMHILNLNPDRLHFFKCDLRAGLLADQIGDTICIAAYPRNESNCEKTLCTTQ